MRDVALGLLVGLTIGGINQWLMWRAVLHGGRDKRAVIARYLGGCALRLALDAAAVYLGWMLTRSVVGIVASATGLLSMTGAFTWWQYRTYRRGRRSRRGVR